MTMTAEQAERVLDGIDTLKAQHGQILAQVAALGGDLKRAAEKADTVHEVVLGNGTPDKGLAARVSKIEDAEETRKWGVRIAIGGVLLGAGKWVAAKLGLPV